MSEEKKLRLLKVAKEFNLGISTITEFLAKRGIEVDASPNTQIDGAAYAMLEKEYGGNRPAGQASAIIREKLNLRPESVSLGTKKDATDHESDTDEIIIKTKVFDIQPKPVQAKSEPKVEPQKIEPKPEPQTIKVETPKVEVKVVEQPKAEVEAEVKVEAPKPVEQPKQAVNSAPKEQPKQKPQQGGGNDNRNTQNRNNNKTQSRNDNRGGGQQTADNKGSQNAPKQNKPSRPVPTAKPLSEVVAVGTGKSYDERMAEDRSDVFRPVTEPSAGPKVLGKIDATGLVSGRHKRKRVGKEKIDVTKQSAPQKGGGGGATGGKGGHNNNQSQNSPNKKDKRKRGNVKPVFRPEVSDEEVQKQVKDTLARLTAKGGKSKTSVRKRDKRQDARARNAEEAERAMAEGSVLKVTEFVTASQLAMMMNVAVTDVITACMNLGLMVSINQRLDAEALVIVAEEFGYSVEFVTVDVAEQVEEEKDNAVDLVERPPIVTVMGHVDHGKTSLLDNIRKTNVIAGEAGGITQHIGAYSVVLNGKKITFLDTPGHEAFTAMRARGAQVTDVAIIIVAADDSVMPQTTEAINHAVAAQVPMVFAINKIDKEGANPERIKEQLAAMNFLVDDWGGKYQSQEISAKQGLNLDKLLEKVLLEAEILELKANPDRKATGTVIESTLDKGRGYVATMLVQNGTLHIGDAMVAGMYSGKVRAMFDENGKKIDAAPPSTPVLVLGLNGAPQAGDTFNIMEDERAAREVANKREQLQRIQGIKTQKHITLDEIGRRIAIGGFKELNIIVKGDVDGSIEAMTDSLIKLSKEEVQVNVIHKAVGQISESDVMLAMASNAIIVGFQVRPSVTARRMAEKEEIEIRLYSVIYDAVEDIKDAIEGMLEPIKKEEIVCSVEVVETFKINKVGTVAGCIVREGKITRSTPIRIIRDGIVIYTGKLGSLKRFKDDVKEVGPGLDCGLNIDGFNDIKVGDIVEGYEIVEVKRK